MKRWLRRVLLVAVPLALIAAGLYEAATHVGRGWLRGEAFYDGRPTSYWRGQIDGWIGRQDSPEEAVRSISLRHFEHDGDEDALVLPPIAPVPFPQTWTRRFLDFCRSDDGVSLDNFPPSLLYCSQNAEPVLRELVQEAKYRAIAERALKNVHLLRKMTESGKQPIIRVRTEPP